MSSENVFRIPPFQYIHVLDNNLNITRLEVGPATFIRKEHETVVAGPSNHIRLAPRTYCIITNPVVFNKDSKPELTDFGQVKNRFGDEEVRTADQYPEPFPLYPGEEIKGKIEKFQIIQQNQALKMTANRDFKDDKVERKAGDEWLKIGPLTYIPRIEESIITPISAEVIKPNSALKLRAKKNTKDSSGSPRLTGEEWLIREVGSYLPLIDEEVVGKVQGVVITDKKALKLKALSNFTDVYGI